MFMYAILFLLVGMVVGHRFRILILAPSILVALVLPICLGIARAETIWTITLTTATAITCLQIGYLVGINMRYVVMVVRASRHRSTSLTSSLPL